MQIYIDYITGRQYLFDTPIPSKYTYVAGQNAAAVTLGNTTTKTLMHSITIPKKTLVVGDSIKVLFSFTCNNNVNNKIVTATINGNAINFGQIIGTAHTGGIMECTLKISSLTQITALTMTTNTSYGLITTASPRIYTIPSIDTDDFTIDIYGQKQTAGTDTLILEQAIAIVQE